MAEFIPFVRDEASKVLNQPISLAALGYGQESLTLSSGTKISSGQYSSNSASNNQASLSSFDLLRACTAEDNWTVRVFKDDGSELAVAAPAVAMSADMVHASSISIGPLGFDAAGPSALLSDSSGLDDSTRRLLQRANFLTSNGNATSEASADSIGATQTSQEPSVIIGAVGNSVYLPPLIRTSQYGKAVFVASTHKKWNPVRQNMSGPMKYLLGWLPLDKLLPKLLLSKEEYLAAASPLPEVVERLFTFLTAAHLERQKNQIKAHNLPPNVLPGGLVVSAAREAGLLKELRRLELPLRETLMKTAGDKFQITQLSNGQWGVSLSYLQPDVVAALKEQEEKDKASAVAFVAVQEASKLIGPKKGSPMTNSTENPENAVDSSPANDATDKGDYEFVKELLDHAFTSKVIKNNMDSKVNFVALLKLADLPGNKNHSREELLERLYSARKILYDILVEKK